MERSQFDELCINTIRFLAVDAVEKAGSGHPGAPLGAASLVYVIWDRFLKHNPLDPSWPDRDRFILSAGHASALLYSLLHLYGYDLSLDDLKRFRQLGSKTPGHPEYGLTPGVETTSGPLGQGFANGVGMAIAERRLSRCYNLPGFDIIDHYTCVLVSDGDLQEGIASEAASLAGHLKLGKLIYLYDSNLVQQDSSTQASFTEDVAQRFRSYNWNVIGPVDGLDLGAVDQAVRLARSGNDRPNLIICRTIIGYGSPHKAGTPAAHGEPLGEEEVRLTKQGLKWDFRGTFDVPIPALDHFRLAVERGRLRQQQWQRKLEEYRLAYPDKARQLESDLRGDLPAGWDSSPDGLFKGDSRPLSTRDASGRILNAFAARVPSLVGGAADLAGSTRTILRDSGDFQSQDYCGRNLRYGLREHAMGAISNGISLHGGIIPFAATFLIFSDYLRPTLRLAAMMKIRVIYVFTHDSIGLGEDGPTHQPVEQLMSLRLIPGLVTIRPADAFETVEGWKIALERCNGPTALVLTRQNLPVLERSALASAAGLRKGGYTIWESGASPEVIIIGTGSEIYLALEAGRQLQARGLTVRVVSLPSWELFDYQPGSYRDSVLPPGIKARVSIEAGATTGWQRYVGREGISIGLPYFGSSAPGGILLSRLGFTPENVVNAALKVLHDVKQNNIIKPG